MAFASLRLFKEPEGVRQTYRHLSTLHHTFHRGLCKHVAHTFVRDHPTGADEVHVPSSLLNSSLSRAVTVLETALPSTSNADYAAHAPHVEKPASVKQALDRILERHGQSSNGEPSKEAWHQVLMGNPELLAQVEEDYSSQDGPLAAAQCIADVHRFANTLDSRKMQHGEGTEEAIDTPMDETDDAPRDSIPILERDYYPSQYDLLLLVFSTFGVAAHLVRRKLQPRLPSFFHEEVPTQEESDEGFHDEERLKSLYRAPPFRAFQMQDLYQVLLDTSQSHTLAEMLQQPWVVPVLRHFKDCQLEQLVALEYMITTASPGRAAELVDAVKVLLDSGVVDLATVQYWAAKPQSAQRVGITSIPLAASQTLRAQLTTQLQSAWAGA